MNNPTNSSLKFGLTEAQFQILNKLLIEPLKQAGAKIWIFGSRARGDHRPASDVDILYEFANSAPPPGFIFSITSDLEESRFPFTVDLVEIKNLAKSYQENILRDRVEIS